ncbi:hypothetical protein L7F22_063904 [Adiantum nelumboides]|nr:hypothetical protein [Adiantum nelumboides]
MPQIQYSEKYFDDVYEYRHVVLTPEITKLLPKNRLLSEAEWRALGVQQSRDSNPSFPGSRNEGLIGSSRY